MTTSTVLVTENTYPVKDQIKALGGRWDAVAKGWRVPADKADDANKLVASAPKSSPRRSSGYRSGRNYRRGYRDWAGDASTCSCDMCRSGSECLCRYA